MKKSAELFGNICVCGALLFACEGFASEKPEFEIVDSGYRATREQSFWIDDHRIIFSGFEGRKWGPQENARTPKSLFIWNVQTGDVSKYDSPIAVFQFCFQDGRIRYPMNYDSKTQTTKWKQGLLGEEKTIEVESKKQKRDEMGYFSDPINCPKLDRSLFEFTKPKQGLVALKVGYGYLVTADFFPRRNELGEPFFLHLPDREAPIEVPFRSGEVLTNLLRYYAFMNSHFLWRMAINPPETRRWRETGCAPGWRIRRDGNVNKICILSGPWSGDAGGVEVTPTAASLFIVSHTSPRTRRISGFGVEYELGGNEEPIFGGYLADTFNSYVKVITGRVNGTSVSPNGCKVAFAHAQTAEDALASGPGERRMKYVELCRYSKYSYKGLKP